MTSLTVDDQIPRSTDGRRTDVTVNLAGITPEQPVLHIPSFIDPDIAGRMASAFLNLKLSPYEVTVGTDEGPAYFFGANLYDARPNATDSVDRYDTYFANASRDRQQFDRLIAQAGLPHPLTDILIPQIEHSLGLPVAVASELGRSYYTPVVRSISNGIHQHNDDGPREAPELIIGSVTSQRSILLYLATPDDGSGQLEVFHKRPTDTDRLHHRHPDHGYTLDAIQDTDSTIVTPSGGDLVVFDAWNIHRVLPSTAGTSRVTVSTFYGELPDHSIIIWS